MKELKSGLYLCKTPGKNYGLHLVESSARNYLALKMAVTHNYFDGLNPFIQSDSDPFSQFWAQQMEYEEKKEKVAFEHNYLFIEFWSDNYDLMLARAMAFAESIDINLSLEQF